MCEMKVLIPLCGAERKGILQKCKTFCHEAVSLDKYNQRGKRGKGETR